ncbi:MAG TPA: flagellar basal body L-ring protein, partial [Devosia sp.]|nr:flagellar basal body L-ring protein [Devosia sp.]
MTMSFARIAFSMLLLSLLGACSAAERLTQIGQTPALSAIQNPVTQQGYRPVVMPMPQPTEESHQSNSLFRNGARGFFKDQRARKVGDILTVKVTISDKAQFSNKSSRGRNSTNSGGLGGALGSLFNVALPNVNASTA